MKAFYTFTSIIMLLASMQVSQAHVTYTSKACTPSGNPFTSGLCWTKTGTCNSSTFPPTSGTSSCQVTINVVTEMTIPSLSLGSNVTLMVSTGGKLTITGNLTQQAEQSSIMIVNGGEVVVQGNLVLLSGKSNAKTKMSIDIRNGGAVDVTGGLMDIQNDAELIIDGDGDPLSTLNVMSFNFGQRSKVDILSGGGLFVQGDVDYRGNNSSINIYGFFRTAGSVLITGGSGNQLNAFGNAEVIIEKNLDVRGTSDITFGGTSETDIGGDILIAGNSKVIATDQATVYVCGGFPTPCDGNNCNTQQIIQGLFSESCRILPVEILYTEAKFLATERSTVLTWATAKEANNSHFEIERSLDGIDNFELIGQVDGMGWKDSITEYVFEDNNLPLKETSAYYRIKQIDFDNTPHYGNVISVKIDAVKLTGQQVWRVYPNPIKQEEKIKISLIDGEAYKSGNISVKIVSTTNQVIAVSASSEGDLNEKLNDLVSKISPGILMVEIQWNKSVEHFKIIKRM